MYFRAVTQCAMRSLDYAYGEKERQRFQTDSKFTQIYIIIIKTNLYCQNQS